MTYRIAKAIFKLGAFAYYRRIEVGMVVVHLQRIHGVYWTNQVVGDDLVPVGRAIMSINHWNALVDSFLVAAFAPTTVPSNRRITSSLPINLLCPLSQVYYMMKVCLNLTLSSGTIRVSLSFSEHSEQSSLQF